MDSTIHKYEDEDCYKVDIYGKTAGLLGVFAHVDDQWGAYVKQRDLLPLYSYRNIHEGKYQLEEEVKFNEEDSLIIVDAYKPHKDKRKPTQYYKRDSVVFDLISGLLFMRNYDFGSLQLQDTVEMQGFLQDRFYDIRLVYEGLDVIDTRVGELTAYRITPLIPKNKIFPGERPITAWFTADRNKLPLKVKANMWVGSTTVELINYRNIRYGPDFSD